MSAVATDKAAEKSSRQAKAQGQLVDHVRKTASVIKYLDLLTRLFACAVVTLAAWLLACVVDHWVFPVPIFVRWMIWLLGAAAFAFVAWRQILPLVMGRINPEYAAIRIEHVEPRFKNGLISWLQLQDSPGGVPRGIMAGLTGRAMRFIGGQEPSSTVDTSPLIKLIGAFLLLSAGMALYAIVSPKSVFDTAQRMLMPWSSTAAPTRVSIASVTPGNATITFGKPLLIQAEVRGTRDGEPVEMVYSSKDRQIENDILILKPTNVSYTFVGELKTASRGVEHELSYYVRAGDARSSEYHVDLQPLPTVNVELLELEYPPYTKIPKQSVVPGNVEAVEGTRVTVRAQSNAPMKYGTIEVNPQVDEDGQYKSAERRVSMEVNARKLSGQWMLELDDQGSSPSIVGYRVRVLNEKGDTNPDPVLHQISVLADLPPEVEIVGPPSRRLRVRPTAKLNIDVRALDPDFGLTAVRLSVLKNDQHVTHVDVISGDGLRGKQSKRQPLNVRALRVKPGDVIELRATAVDNRHDAEGKLSPNSAEAEPLFLDIVDPQQPNDEQQLGNQSGADDAQPSGAQEGGRDSDNSSGGQSNSTPNNQNQSGKSGEQGGESGGGSSGGAQSNDGGAEGNKGNQQGGAGQGQSGSEQSGEGGSQGGQNQSSGDQSSEGNTSSEQSGSGQSGPEQTGGGQSGSGQSDSTQSKNSGQVGADNQSQNAANQSGNNGQNSSEQSASGQNDSGQNASSQDASPQSGDSANGQSPQQGGPQDDSDAMRRVKDFIDQQKRNGQQGDRSPEQNANSGSASNQNPDETGAQSGGERSQNSSGENQRPSDSSEKTQSNDGRNSGNSDSSEQDQGQNGNSSEGGGKNSQGQPDGDTSASEGNGSKDPSRDGSNQEQPTGGQGADQGDSANQNAENQSGAGQEGTQSQSRDSASGQDERSNDGSNGNGSQNTDPQQGGDRSDNSKSGDQSRNQNGDNSGSNDSNDQSSGNDSGAGKQDDASGRDGSDSGKSSAGESSSGEQSSSGSEKSGDGGAQQSESGQSGSSKQGESGKQSESGKQGKPGEQSKSSADSAGQGESEAGKSGEGAKDSSESPKSNGSNSEESNSDGTKPSQSQSGEQQSAKQPGDPASQGENSQQQNSQQQGNQSQENSQQQGSQPQSNQNSQSSSSKPGPGKTNSANSAEGKSGSGSSGSAAGPGDKANEEFSEEATNMVLDYLDRQRDQPDPELLKKLDWTESDMQRFVDRWNQARDLAANGTEEDRQRWLDMLESLNRNSDRSGSLAPTADNDDFRQFSSSTGRRRPPESLRRQWEAFYKATRQQ